MKSQNSSLKIVFGLLIFLFSVALAYFTANYLDESHAASYWPTVAGFAGIYVLTGILVSFIFPISLGFLFSADVLILHILLEKYGGFSDVLKLTLVGSILAVLYVSAYVRLGDSEYALPMESSASPASTPGTPSGTERSS